MNKTKIRATEQPIAVDIEDCLLGYLVVVLLQERLASRQEQNCDRSQGSLFHRKSQEILAIFGRIERFSIYVLWRV